MLPPEVYLRGRRKARYHVQVEIESVAPKAERSYTTRVHARVRTVFKSDGTVGEGTLVEFDLWVVDSWDDISTGPVWFLLADTVKPQKLLEVFLVGEPPACEVVSWQACPIPARSTTPRMSLDEL